VAFPESDLLPISALQHVVFCERQFSLIHIEGVWSENWHTARGRFFHERAHEGQTEVRGTLVRSFGVPVRSLELGVTGVTDAVEFYYEDETLSRLAEVVPVEYKVGAKKKGLWDIVQVGAQAVCLEEMTGVRISEAHLFYGKTRRRTRVEIDSGIRSRVERAAERIHELVSRGETPVAEYSPDKCDACSLIDICKPRLSARAPASTYVDKAIALALQDREG
jgi:CRISPR-associated exonuclease Cas4